MITICYDEEIHKMREAEYNQEIGEKRGKQIGQQLSEKQKALSIARKMHESGMSDEQIMHMTELTKNDLKQLL